MDYGQLLSKSFALWRRQRTLWSLGILAAVGNEALAAVVQVTVGEPAELINADSVQILTTIETRLTDTSWLTSAVIIFFFALLFIWLISTIAEGGLITAAGTQPERPLSFTAGLQAGWRLLWRFILVDTVLFFPVFLVALAILLVTFGTFISIALQFEEGGPPPVRAFTGMMACVVPLACLLLPVALLTFLSRIIAFRAAALNDLKTRPTLHHTWQIFRKQFVHIVIIAIIVVAIRTAVGLIRSFVLIPIGLLTASFTSDAILITAELVTFTISLLIAGLLHAYTSTLWTRFYQALPLSEAPKENHDSTT